MSGTIYAFANQKGGVGKTTTAVNIGAFLAWRGRRVLLVDLDPQGNASASVGVDRFSLPASLYDVFAGNVTLREILAQSTMEGLTVAPSAPALASVEVELANTADREFILRETLRDVRADFDHILIDSPPSLGVLTVNALSAAEFVVVPVQCEYLALEGLAQLMQTITLVRENLNPNLRLFGLVMTMFDPRARLASQVIQEVRAHFSNELFETLVPRNVRVAEAPGFGEPLVKFDIHSRGAEAYEKLTNEFLMREARITNRSPNGDSDVNSPLSSASIAPSPELKDDPDSEGGDSPSIANHTLSPFDNQPSTISQEQV